MATAQPIPPHGAGPSNLPQAPASAEHVAERSLVPMSQQPLEDELPKTLTGPVSRLPVELDVAVPVRDFRVRNLLARETGPIIETEWAHGEDMPLAAGDVQLAWSEFEVVENQLAVRITRLA